MRALSNLFGIFLILSLSGYSFGDTVPVWPADQKVILVILENTSYSEAIKAPFLSQLAKGGALMTEYHAIGHPSEPNYVALIAGDTLGVNADDQYDLDSTSIADLLEAQGKTWRVYAEGFPGNCFTGMTSGEYARKHVPFMSFKNISTDSKRCANIMNSTNDSVIGGTNQVYAAFYGPSVKPGTQVSTNYSHYNILRTIEDGFGLGNLGRNDAKATDLTGFWQ